LFEEKPSKLASKGAKIALAVIPILIIAGYFGFVSLNKDEKKKVATTESTTTTTKEKKKEIIAPLTGLVDETGLSETRPALAVKIGNNAEARPQAGINEADIIYEEIVEGGVTRYMAIYNSQVPARVGPVRSVRGMDPNIALNWGGIFAYSGGAPQNETKIKGTKGIVALNETAAGDGMKRDSARGAPNNLYVQTATMFVKGGTPIPPKAQFTFSAKPITVGDPALKFEIGFKSGFACTWQYDAATNKYLRFYGTKPVVDQEGKQVAASNVVVQTIVYPSESEGVTTGSGKVQIFRDGKMLTGTWNRPNNSNPAEYLDAKGSKIALTPGQTWVELASASTPVTLK